MGRNKFIKIGVFLILLGTIVMSFETVSAYINDYNNDVKRSREILSNINDNYKLFNNYALKIKNDMSLVYESFDFYFDDFDLIEEKILEKIKIIEGDFIDIYSSSKIMYDNCKYNLSNDNQHNKCNIFYINYRSMLDSYNHMIEEYNKIIVLYNKYAEKNNKSVKGLYEGFLADNMYEIYKEV